MEMAMKGILAVFWLILVPVAVGRLPFVKRRQPLLAERFVSGYLILFSIMEVTDTSDDVFENAAACAGDILWYYCSASGSRQVFLPR